VRTEDGYLIHKCLNGEKEAFGFLVDKYRTSVYAFAYSLLWNFHDAEDITQEAFLQAFQKLPTLKQWDSFRAWLYVITSNLCKKFIRKNYPDREFFSEQDVNPFDDYSMNSYQEKQVYELLHEALDSLPEMYRQVLTLYYIGGMSGKEIAEFLGTSPSNIRQRLNRARAKLKKEMLDMMSKTYEQHKLQPSFTLRIVEMVKHIKIRPAPRSTPLLPFGLSATGIVLTVLMFSSHLISLTPLGALLGSPLPSETKVMEYGELPVDVLEISEITFLASEQGDGNDRAKKLPDQQNAFAPPLAPSGEGTWTKKADMPTARHSLSTSVVNGKIYAIGGAPDSPGIFANAISTVEEYNPMADTWTRKTDMPTARWGLSTAVVNGKIYAIGGLASPNAQVVSAVEEYNPKTNKWVRKADMPTVRAYFSTSVVGGKIYAIGGNNRINHLSIVEEYDAVTDTWTKKADMPTARTVLANNAPAVNGKIYVIGGAAGAPPLSTVEEYDPATDTWTKKTDMPTARGGFAINTVNRKIYVIGGSTGDGHSLPTVEEYDPTTDTWTRKADMPTGGRWYDSASAVNGYIYAIGGIRDVGDLGLSTVEAYDTGFRAVDMEGKLPTTWGRMKGE